MHELLFLQPVNDLYDISPTSNPPPSTSPFSIIIIMQFTKFASLSVLFFVALFGVVVANPIPERALSVDAEVSVVLAALTKSLASPIASISSCFYLYMDTTIAY
jgi:hypothetical protein